MKVALISFNPVWENKEDSKLKALELLQLAATEQADWIIFPEMTLTGFSTSVQKCAEEPGNSESIRFFAECALKHGVYVSFGLALKKGDIATNNLVTISPKGELIANYAKIHPFSHSKENEYYAGGKELVSATICDVPAGMSICYDLRFPEMFQALSAQCKIIVNIANWPSSRGLHWNVFLQARAIENQAFFIGVNRTGTDGNNIVYQKSSTVFGPKGIKVEGHEVSPEVDVFELNVARADEYRKAFPVRNDRKPELYAGFAKNC